MKKKDLGNLLVFEGMIIFISCTLFWVILSKIFGIYTSLFSFGLLNLPGTISFLFISAALIAREGRKDVLRDRKYHVFGIVYIIFAIYIFILLVLIDSPIGPPILGPTNVNVDYGGSPAVLYLMSLPELILTLSGIGLLVSKSRLWLVIGSLTWFISMVVLQYWFGNILWVYDYAA